MKDALPWQLYLHIPHSPHWLLQGYAGEEVVPSSGVVHQLEVWRGVPQLPWQVLQEVLLFLLGRPSLRHLWLGRLESHLLWRQHREEASPYPWREENTELRYWCSTHSNRSTCREIYLREDYSCS